MSSTELILEPGRTERHYWRDLWRYRELFYILAWRDVTVRYKQTVVGLAWSLIRPILTMAVLTLVFGKLGRMPAGGVPYPLLVFAGLLPWQLFAAAMSESGNSLVSNSNLISKVYFPRLVVPASSVITSSIDFLISCAFLAGLMAYHDFLPPAQILLLPVFTLLALAASFGIGLWVASLMVAYRDFRFLVPFAVQFGLYISPVGFTSAVVPAEYRIWYALNPIVSVIDGFRWCLLGGDHVLHAPSLLLGTVVIITLLLSGLWYFRRTEKGFADLI
jgi:lipopolysaccharide transport system permease protein